MSREHGMEGIRGADIGKFSATESGRMVDADSGGAAVEVGEQEPLPTPFDGIEGEVAKGVRELPPEAQEAIGQLLNQEGLRPEALSWVEADAAGRVNEQLRAYTSEPDPAKRRALGKRIAAELEQSP